MKQYIDYLNDISIEKNQHKRIMERLNQKDSSFAENHTVRQFLKMATCAAVLILCVFTFPKLLPKPNTDLPKPVNANFKDYQNEDIYDAERLYSCIINYQRMGFMKISDFFSSNMNFNFVFAKVIAIDEQKVDTETTDNILEQTVTLKIIKSIYGETELPETIKVIQLKGGEYDNYWKDHLLQANGTYFLPIIYYGDINSDVIAQYDVLFEVDEAGRIWSHSKSYGFYRFDGKPADDLTDFIVAQTTDKNFSKAFSDLGRVVGSQGALSEVEILSSEFESDEYGNTRISYQVKVNKVLMISPDIRYAWQVNKGDEIHITSNDYIDYLVPGKSYLMVISTNGTEFNLNSDQVAKIKETGRITPVSIYNVFNEYNGYTCDEVKKDAELAIEWYIKYAK